MAAVPRPRGGGRTQQHEGFLSHARYRWLYVALAASLVAAATYRLSEFRPRPSGGTWYGYATGVAAASMILWLTALGVRKRAITPGAWSLKGWVSAHVYLGASLLVIATLHTGFAFGWNVHTLAYGLMLLVIGSGFAGVAAYVYLPRRLSTNRGETTERQMVESIRSLDRQLFGAAQHLDETSAAAVRLSLERTKLSGSLWQRVTGRYGDCGNARAITALAALGRNRAPSDSPGDLEQIKALLDQKASRLALMRRHIRIRAALEIWLYVHVPTTFALLAALTAHIVSVFFYW